METEAEAAILNKELSTHKASIDNVRNKFARQLGSLEKKQQSVKESRDKWESKTESIKTKKTLHEAKLQAHSVYVLSIQSELSVAKSFKDIVSQLFNDANSAAVGEDPVGNLDSDVLKYEAAVGEANRNVHSAEAAIKSLEEEVLSIEVKLPVLEAEKKMATSKRDFKAADKASKEIKDALARKEQYKAELADEALVRKEDAKEALSKAVALLDEKKKSIAAEKGMELGLKQMAALKDKIRDLRSILKDFDVSTDPDSLSVASVGAFVIESQIGILEARSIALCEKYGGWNDSPKPNEVVGDDTVKQPADPETASKVLAGRGLNVKVQVRKLPLPPLRRRRVQRRIRSLHQRNARPTKMLLIKRIEML
jgi:hypothetical protein